MPEAIVRTFEAVRRSFQEFLFIPVAEVVGFCLLSFGAFKFDDSAPDRGDWGAFRRALDAYIGTADNASSLLQTVATSLITITSITFSILLLAVQQSSAAMTNQVVDQYLGRRSNQWFFGFFVGTSIYALNCLAFTRRGVTPVLGTTLALILCAMCVFSLIVLIYSTLDQTRPASIISRIHQATRDARKSQMIDLKRTSNSPMPCRPVGSISSTTFGYVARIDVDRLCKLASKYPAMHIDLMSRLGDPVFAGQDIAAIGGIEAVPDDAEREVRGALTVSGRRELANDPMFGVDQLGNIAWTATSTAKSNPAAALNTCHALNDLLWRWARSGDLAPPDDGESRVHMRDDLGNHIACAYESLMVVASESMQHQTLAEISRGLARTIPHLPADLLDDFEDIVLRSLSGLGDQVPTGALSQEFSKLADAFRAAGKAETANALDTAWRQLKQSVGILHSRAGRVPSENVN